MANHALARAWEVLESVPDPEIPVVSIRELGILRDVRRAADGQIEVVITPTYSGCPAMSQIAEDVAHALDAAQLAPYRIATTLTAVDHRLDHRRSARKAARLWHRAAYGQLWRRHGPSRQRAVDYVHPEAARARLPALRLEAHRTPRAVRLDRL